MAIKKSITNKPIETNIILQINNFARIQAMCSDVHRNLRLAAIVGEPGLGKTTALQYYKKSYENVFYVLVGKSMSATHFYLALLAELDDSFHDKDIPLHFLIKKICYILNNKSGNNLLIIDEAGKFSTRMLEYLHEVRDRTSTTTGIILAGPGYFETNIMKWVSKNIQGIPEIYTRINYWQHLELPTKTEIKAICEAYQITDEQVIKPLLNIQDFRSLMNEITTIKVAGTNSGTK